ncbi:DUF5615 family PIN-like protein [Neolewinella sp.]|uniref:DUF5615 family PIN-like protein n=1 Tax=Neolewinella sp. TaxID=2993543 RepID=UPI003B51A2C3
MTFLADESVDFNIVKQLREAGLEIMSIIETTPGIPDKLVLQRANELQTVLITEDKDFGELTYRLKLPNHGIVLRMDGEPLDHKLTQIRQLIAVYGDRLKSSFCVLTGKKNSGDYSIEFITQHLAYVHRSPAPRHR